MFRKGFFAEAICEFSLRVYYKNISSGSHHINLHIKKVGNNIPYLIITFFVFSRRLGSLNHFHLYAVHM